MFWIWKRRNRDEHRYYLLPGMGRSNRRRHRQFFVASIVIGTAVSLGFAYVLYLLSHRY